MFDLDAYLERIGLSGRPSVRETHLAHSTTIPFENLDPHMGRAVSLEPEDLQRKLVGERRGGYCFEQNLLLAAALRALGAEVELLTARVRCGAPPGTQRPRSHLLLRVRENGCEWHADVGFGLGTLLEPLPFGSGAEHEQGGWRHRVRDDDAELVLQSHEDGGWVDLYAFSTQPVPPIDLVLANWWTSTHPNSPFVSGLIVAGHDRDGRRVSLDDRSGALALSERTPGERTVTPLRIEQAPAILSERFGLPGFRKGPDGRLHRAD